MVFPTYEDYEQVKNSPYNDYLPCIVSIQFRLRPEKNGVQKLNTIFNMRSWNIDQKGAGDLVIFSMLNHKVCELLSKRLNKNIQPGSIDGLVTDVHIYQNTIEIADEMVSGYNTKLLYLAKTADKLNILKKSAAIVLKDKKVLYLKKRGFPYFILPGGRMEVGESKTETLNREMLEEISSKVNILEKLDVISGKGVDPDNNELFDMELTLYRVDNLSPIKLSSEICDMKYLSFADLSKYPMTPIGVKTIEYLHAKGFID